MVVFVAVVFLLRELGHLELLALQQLDGLGDGQPSGQNLGLEVVLSSKFLEARSQNCCSGIRGGIAYPTMFSVLIPLRKMPIVGRVRTCSLLMRKGAFSTSR